MPRPYGPFNPERSTGGGNVCHRMELRMVHIKRTQRTIKGSMIAMDLTNYVDVPTRFAAALERWPELRIMENRPEIISIDDKTFISVTMQAWRTPDDPIPCQATCFEPFPGKTSFTRDSEQMNASTSALGRVLGLMMSFGPKLASFEEVRNRQPDDIIPHSTLVRSHEKPRTATLGAKAEAPTGDGPTPKQLAMLRAKNWEGAVPATKREASELIDRLMNGG